MINVKTKNNTITILFLFLSISVFSQKIYTNPRFDYSDSRYRIYYKTDRKTQIKVYIRMFMIENEKYPVDYPLRCDMVTLFLKKDNPWLAKDFNIVSTCIGNNITKIEFIHTTSDDTYLYVEVSYDSTRINQYVFVFEKDEEGLYHLIRQQEYGSGTYEETKIRWYKGKYL